MSSRHIEQRRESFKGALSPFLAKLWRTKKMHVYRNNGLVLVNWLCYCKETVNKCVWLRVAMHDANGLQLENFWQIFSSCCSCVSDKISKNWFWLVFLSKFIWFCCLSSLKASYAWARYFHINLVNLWQKHRKQTWDYPLGLLGKKLHKPGGKMIILNPGLS